MLKCFKLIHRSAHSSSAGADPVWLQTVDSLWLQFAWFHQIHVVNINKITQGGRVGLSKKQVRQRSKHALCFWIPRLWQKMNIFHTQLFFLNFCASDFYIAPSTYINVPPPQRRRVSTRPQCCSGPYFRKHQSMTRDGDRVCDKDGEIHHVLCQILTLDDFFLHLRNSAHSKMSDFFMLFI